MKTAVKKREKNMRITIPASLAKKGKLVVSAKKAEKFITSKFPQRMGKNFVLDRAKTAASGLDDLYSGISKQEAQRLQPVKKE